MTASDDWFEILRSEAAAEELLRMEHAYAAAVELNRTVADRPIPEDPDPVMVREETFSSRARPSTATRLGACRLLAGAADAATYSVAFVGQHAEFNPQEAIAEAAMWAGIVLASVNRLSEAAGLLEHAFEHWRSTGIAKAGRAAEERAEVAVLAGDTNTAGTWFDRAAVRLRDLRPALAVVLGRVCPLSQRRRAAPMRLPAPRGAESRAWVHRRRDVGLPSPLGAARRETGRGRRTS